MALLKASWIGGFAIIVAFTVLAGTSLALPEGFMYGMATASYQIEGAWNVSGRGPSIWDTFSHTPGKVANGSTGDVADDFYHLFSTDIALMAEYGLTHFRLSLSWTRIFPHGSGEINMAGIHFYNSVINLLLAYNIEPLVTLFHWDYPQTLEDKYIGWLSPSSVQDFVNYADTAFRFFGDRVKFWSTFNEPLTFCNLGYGTGGNAPGRCSDRARCTFGNSSVEPWIAGHHVLLSHAEAVKVYRRKYQHIHGGVIGIALNSDWSEPLTNSQADRDAAQRSMDFMLGWFADPIWFGDYPQSLKDRVAVLPKFTDEQKSLLKGSYDYFGLNHYTSRYVSNVQATPSNLAGTASHDKDINGVPIGPVADSDWLIVVPWGFQNLLKYVWNRYHTRIIVTENGVDAPKESQMPLEIALQDKFRVDYYRDYLANMQKAMDSGAQIVGYFAWSFMDNFEWADGYAKRFGVTYVDYANGLKRYPKQSATFLKNFFLSWK